MPGGSAPIGGLVKDNAGALYGVTYLGGYTGGAGAGFGVVYKLSPPAPGKTRWTQTILHAFHASGDGGWPSGELTFGPDGALYGAASSFGSGIGIGWGSIFRLEPPTPARSTWRFSRIYRFKSILDGRAPFGPLIFDENGVIYGLTALGGNGNAAGPLGGGTLFSLTRASSGGWTKKTLYTFGNLGAPDGPSSGLVRDSTGALIGVTERGGARNQGTAYRVAKDAAGVWRLSILHSFGNSGPGVSTDGEWPNGPLALAPDGSVFGATLFGGRATSNGTIFKLTPPRPGSTRWTEELVYVFSSFAHDGQHANGVILDGAGGLYGTTGLGGGAPPWAPLEGTLFRLTPPAGGVGLWRKTTLHSFAGGVRDGAAPMGRLLLSNGTIFGVTQNGGPGSGTVYSYVTP